MRFVKLGIISAVALFGIILLISLLLPSQIRISRAIDINAPAEKIYPLLADINQWEKWNEYIRVYHNRVTEPDMLKADEIAIFITGKKGSLITADWQQPSGNKFGSGFAIISNADGHGHTTVQWYFDFHVNWYPWEKFQSIVYDGQLGPVMEKSLASLGKLAENNN
ncbi:MAG: SRPBCC family protein [Chitinophagaceae bacterium]